MSYSKGVPINEDIDHQSRENNNLQEEYMIPVLVVFGHYNRNIFSFVFVERVLDLVYEFQLDPDIDGGAGVDVL